MTHTNGKVYTYYPGCSQMAINRAYDVSSRSAAHALGFELDELDDWNCCGATAYVAINEKEAFLLSARNLALAEGTGRYELVTACNGCYLVLNKANKYMSQNRALRADIDRALSAGAMRYAGNVRVRHLLDIFLNDAGEETIRARVTRPLKGLKVAPYYGCQLGRPFGDIDDEEFPENLDNLVTWLGGSPAPFPSKAKCCGGLMMTTQPEIGKKMTGKILHSAKTHQADCVITCCPLCQVNLEAYQEQVGAVMGSDCHIPVLYFTQLMGYAFGLDAKTLALKDSLTPVVPMLAEKVGSA